MTDQPMTAIVLPTAVFVNLLADVSQAASRDEHLSMLAGVMLHTDTHKGQTVLVATATDRFTLIQGHAPVAAGPPDQRLWLTGRQVSQLRGILRPFTTRRVAASSQLAIELVGDMVHFRQLALEGFAGVALSLPIEPGEFPNVIKIAQPSEPYVPSDQPVTIDPRYLRRMAALCRSGENVTVQFHGPAKPAWITIGDNAGSRLWAIVMPIRQESISAAPVFDPSPVKPAEELAA